MSIASSLSPARRWSKGWRLPRAAAPIAGLLLIAGLSCLARATASEGPAQASRPDRLLRVCADPNNLPFSNEQEQGFENRMAEIVAKELGATLEYTWWAQRRGFFRNTLNAGRCDIVMGVPKQLELVATTNTLYRSTYVFVTQRTSGPPLRSLGDPALAERRIGVHVIGDDYTNTPPVHALGRRGVVRNLVGYRLTDDYAKPNPPARLIEAVVSGEVDVAIVWGPLGGYFAQRSAVPLDVRPVPAEPGPGAVPLQFDIAFGVRKADTQLRAELNRVLATRRGALRAVLRSYGVPLVEG